MNIIEEIGAMHSHPETVNPSRGLELHAAEARIKDAALDMLAALEDAAKVINAMHAGKLPPCFKPTLEMVNAINFAIYKAKGP